MTNAGLLCDKQEHLQRRWVFDGLIPDIDLILPGRGYVVYTVQDLCELHGLQPRAVLDCGEEMSVNASLFRSACSFGIDE
jgi:hypothetical protein